jgi:transposase
MGSPQIADSPLAAKRIGVLQQVIAQLITQRAAAAALSVSYRQMKRLVARYRAHGPAGMLTPKRSGNRRLPAEYTERIVRLVQEHYADCGPTLVRQQLQQQHGLTVGRETLRTLLRDNGIWIPRTARRMVVMPPVARKQRLGELVHIAGCLHRWFEERAPACTLLMYSDDATGRLQLLRFVEGEATFDYMQAAKSYLQRYGKPLAFYDDKHAAVRIVHRHGIESACTTQYGRALGELGIELLLTAAPATRARIRRTLRTLHGRLVSELRRRNLSSIAAANNWIDGFVDTYNVRYGRRTEVGDAHRPLSGSENLDETFTWRESRSLSSALSLQYDKVLYLIDPSPENRILVGRRVTVFEFPDGRVKIRFEGRELGYRQFDKQTPATRIELGDHKRLGALLCLTSDRGHPLIRVSRNLRGNRRYVTHVRRTPAHDKP